MSYKINVGNIHEKFYGVDEGRIWSNLTWDAILNDDELLVSVFEDAGYPLDGKKCYEQLEVDEKAQWAKDSSALYHLQEDYYPITSYVHVLQHEPTKDKILDVAKNARNVVVIKDEHDNYLLGLSGCGMDLSEQLAYAYMVIDGEVPTCFKIREDEVYSTSHR